MQRKIIRNGEMIFEVDSFDSSMMQVAKIAARGRRLRRHHRFREAAQRQGQGHASSSAARRTASTRWCSSCAAWAISRARRSPPRTSPSSTPTWRASFAPPTRMEERLLQIIKDGKGAIKDLLEAEKQLGVWREKIEGLEGEIRYYNNLVSLSTLTITLIERDIKTPYATAQTEQVSMGVEAEDVEKARADAIKQIEEAKGRILESDLKKHEAGAVLGDHRGGRAARRGRPADRPAQADRPRGPAGSRAPAQTSEGGTGAPPPGVKIERQGHAPAALDLQPGQHRPADHARA